MNRCSSGSTSDDFRQFGSCIYFLVSSAHSFRRCGDFNEIEVVRRTHLPSTKGSPKPSYDLRVFNIFHCFCARISPPSSPPQSQPLKAPTHPLHQLSTRLSGSSPCTSIPSGPSSPSSTHLRKQSAPAPKCLPSRKIQIRRHARTSQPPKIGRY